MILDYMKFVRSSLTDDLRLEKYRGNPNKMVGHCYVACEALWHLLGCRQSGFKPMVMRIANDTHWILKNGGVILDPTIDQFDTIPDYSTARGCGFLTRSPSKRAAKLIHSVEAKLAGW